MKVYILGVGRSGTTSLIHSFKEQGYHAIIEPYSGHSQMREYPLSDFYDYTNVVVKNTCYQKPGDWSGHWHDFNLDFINYFDKIIFLDRRDFNEHYNSFINLMYRVSRNESTMKSWADADIPIEFKKGYELGGGRSRLHAEKESLKKLIFLIGQKGTMTFYEDLYGPDRSKSLEVIKGWGIDNIDHDKLNRFLDPSKKLYRGVKRQSI